MLAVLTLVLPACGGNADNTVVFGATTSVSDSGLLDALISAFEVQSNATVTPPASYPVSYKVTPVAGGSGQIIEQARRGDLDVIMTHSPTDEAEFVADGEGLEPRAVMENYFIVAGPPDDPAGVAGASTPGEAFRAIARAEAPFLSRGDNSGTHRRELTIWKSLGIKASEHGWYQESAVSQGQNLLVASDKGAYTLVDSSTFITLQHRVNLSAFVTDTETPNVYTVTLVNPASHSRVNAEAARAFAEFLTSARGQLIIREFGQEEFGRALFVPLAGSPSAAETP
jgi:tungstate transport system substrate-binding protein